VKIPFRRCSKRKAMMAKTWSAMQSILLERKSPIKALYHADAFEVVHPQCSEHMDVHDEEKGINGFMLFFLPLSIQQTAWLQDRLSHNFKLN
jgi:hypothetical protein